MSVIKSAVNHLYYNRFAIVSLTRRCNCRCYSCDMWKGKDTINIQQFIDVGLEILHKAKFGVIEYTGGEVTLLRELPKIVAASNKYGFIVQIMTNGTHMTKKLSQELAAAGANIVNISVDHYDDTIASRYRGFPNINKQIKKTVKLLKNKDIFLCSSTLIAQHNFREIEKVVDFVNNDLGIYFSFCNPESSDYYPLGSNIRKQHITREDLLEVYEKLLDLKHSGACIINSTSYIEELIRYLRGEPTKFPCKGGKDIIYINWNMDVFPCFKKGKICKLEELDANKLQDTKCTACGFQCFREPSIYYYFSGKLQLLRDMKLFKQILPKLQVI